MRRIVILVSVFILNSSGTIFSEPINEGLLATQKYCVLPDCVLNLDLEEVERVTQEAINKRDYKICHALPKEVWFSINRPKEGCMKKVAEETKDINICIELNDYYCYQEVARLRQDVSLCSNMEKNLNLSRYYDAYDCFIAVAAAKQDSAICDLYGKTLDDRLWCKMRLSEVDPRIDKSICDQFVDPANKEGCRKYFGEE